ncbi:unnamed protein product [Kuraishia capsulata CBS 1993]|uniref:Zn(2)-C6 fungal-type domain-containing protein n=1 Tax=Kuraishia capsulata CBS 1993 TaxID=1382522 RepID=W6MV38_9ASCO|nr:uncharacterized protein KUCA_T00005745001 [Kuraishia capsulata CBS 1993]CDK29752.1 unnamed protein product [Kuraishia capsulata CBS 1993]
MTGSFVTTSVDGHNQLVELSGDPRDRIKRKRNRPSISCLLCKKRKVKCDRQRPTCGTCKRSGMPAEACVYADSRWRTSGLDTMDLTEAYDVGQLSEENEHLNRLLMDKEKAVHGNTLALRMMIEDLQQKLRMANPQIDPPGILYKPMDNMLRCFVSDVDGVTTFYGPTSWKTCLVQDIGMARFLTGLIGVLHLEREKWSHDRKQVQDMLSKELISRLYRSDPVSVSGDRKSEKLAAFASLSGSDCSTKFIASKSFAITQDSPNYTQNLLRMLSDVLPPYDVFCVAVRYFIQQLAKYFPCVDIKLIEQPFSKLFKRADDGSTLVEIQRDPDLFEVACVIMALKFAITFDDFSLDLKGFSDREDMLLWFAERTLEFGDFGRNGSYSALTAWVLITIFCSYDIREAGYDDSKHFGKAFSNALSVAYSVGAHRDLRRVFAFPSTSQISLPISAEASRGLWISLRYVDAVRSLAIGRPLLIVDEGSDVVGTSPMEKVQESCTTLLRQAVSKLTNVTQKIRLIDIENEITNIENFLLSPGETIRGMALKANEDAEGSRAILLNLKFSFQTLELLLCVVSHGNCLATEYLNGRENPHLTEEEKQELTELKNKYRVDVLRLSVFIMCVVNFVATWMRNGKALNRALVLQPQLRKLFRRAAFTVGTYMVEQFSTENVYQKSHIPLLVDNLNVDMFERIIFIDRLPKEAITDELLDMKTQIDRAIVTPRHLLSFLSGVFFNTRSTFMVDDYGFYINNKYVMLFCEYLSMKNVQTSSSPSDSETERSGRVDLGADSLLEFFKKASTQPEEV